MQQQERMAEQDINMSKEQPQGSIDTGQRADADARCAEKSEGTEGDVVGKGNSAEDATTRNGGSADAVNVGADSNANAANVGVNNGADAVETDGNGNADAVCGEILEVATEKMRSVGIRSVSIDDICRQLGISKKTFYVYFESKDQLVKEMLLVHERKMEEKMLHEIEGKSIIQILSEWAEIAQRNEKDMEQTPPLVYDLDKYYPALSMQHRERLCDMMYRGLLRFVHKGQEEGVFRAELDADMTARLLAYSHHLTLEQLRLYPKRREEIVAIARQGFEVAGRGIITEQGLRMMQARKQQKPTT